MFCALNLTFNFVTHRSYRCSFNAIFCFVQHLVLLSSFLTLLPLYYCTIGTPYIKRLFQEYSSHDLFALLLLGIQQAGVVKFLLERFPSRTSNEVDSLSCPVFWVDIIAIDALAFFHTSAPRCHITRACRAPPNIFRCAHLHYVYILVPFPQLSRVPRRWNVDTSNNYLCLDACIQTRVEYY